MSELSDSQIRTTRTPVAVAISVWKALFLREALTRLSAERAAWLWLLLEPIGHVAVLMILFSTIRKRMAPGVDFALFFALGILGFNLFRNAALRSMNAISANAALFAYRQCKPVDAVMVRILLEGVIQSFVAVVILIGSSFFGFEVVPGDPLQVMTAWMLLWMFGAGVGFMLSVGVTLIPEIGKVVELVVTPLYFLSGVIFLPSMAPAALRDLILLNPILHGLEALREPFFPEYQIVQGANLYYLAAFAALSLFIGLLLHIRYASKLVTL